MSEDQVVVYKGDRSFRDILEGAAITVFAILCALFGPGYMRIIGIFLVVVVPAAVYFGLTTRLEIGSDYAVLSTRMSRRRCTAPASIELRDMAPTSFSRSMDVLYVTENRPGGTTICIALHVFGEDSREELEKAIRKAMK